MPAQNSHTHYGVVAKTLHWITATLIVVLIPLGLIANDAPFGTDAELAQKAWLFSLHKTLGVTLFAVALARILWALTQTKPTLLNADRRAEAFLAELVHWLLYGSLVLVPIAGWISHAAATGFAPIWWPFGQSLPMVPKSAQVAELFGGAHGILSKVLIISLLLHIAGALKHHFLDRDATLKRMLPGQPAVPALSAQNRSHLPFIVAPLVFIAAIGIGAAAGVFSTPEADEQPTAALPTEEGNWQVSDGQLRFTVRQLGQEVAGSFTKWTAKISYDEASRSGSVSVTIDMTSANIGSVTPQALGPEFFDTANNPTAVFDAVIKEESGQMAATGTLTLRGMSAIVTLPFTLEVEGDTAHMLGNLTLDRRDFGIGPSYPDEASVGFAVGVAVDLTAQRN